MDFGIASVPAITVIAYIVGAAVRATKLDSKWIPVICGCIGGGSWHYCTFRHARLPGK